MKKNLRNKFSLFKYFLLICVSITTLIFGMNEGFAQSDDDLESRLLNLKPHNSKTPRKKRVIRSNSSTYNLNNDRERDTQPPTASEKPKAKKNFLGKIFGKKAPTEEKFTTIPNDFSLVQAPPKQEGYNLRASVSDLLKNNQEMTNNPLLIHLNQQYILQEHIERFDEYLNNNEAITALKYAEDTKLSSELKKTAVDKILSDLNEQNIKQILFVDNLKDVRILNFTKSINKENRPILAAIIQNASEEQKDVFFDRVVDYVDRNLITLETQGPSLGVRLVLTQLKSINNKKEIEKLLLRKNKIKEELKKYYKNGQYENIPQKVIAEINKKLKADSLTTNDLNQNEIISLINGFDKNSLEKSINVILSSPEIIKKEIKEKLLPTSQPVLTGAVWTGTTPPPVPKGPPPPPIHNNHNLNINDLEQNYPKLHKLHEKLAKQGNNIQQKPLSTKVNNDEITEPTTEYGELYKTYLTESNTKLPMLHIQQVGAVTNITNTIRQILTAEYKDDFGTEKLINLFSKDNQDKQATEIKSKATEIYEELSKDPYVTPIIIRTKENIILNNLFQESSDEAMKRLLLPSSKISENQKNFILTIQKKEEKEQELAGYNDRLEQLRFIANNSNVFGSQKLNDNIEELVNDSSKLTNTNKITILLNKNEIITELKNKNIISDDQVNNLRTQIITTINLEAIKAFASDNNINSADFIRLIQEYEKPEILREFLAVVVTIEENKQNNILPQYNKLALPSIANFSQEDVALLSQRMTVAGLIKALTEIGQENIGAQQQNKPPITPDKAPPLPSMMTSSELDNLKLKAAGVNDDLIERALKLKADNNKIIPKTPITPNKFNSSFNSSAGKKYSERITKNATSFELNIKMHGAGKVLNDIILESVLEIYAKKPFDKLDEKVNTETLEEALSTLSPDFIGCMSELGNEIYKIYNEIIAETVKDTEFLKNLAKDIKPLTGNKLLDKAIKTQADALEEEKALELVPTLFAQAEKDYENQQEALKAKALEQEQLNADAAAIALEQQRLEQERIDTEALEQKKLEADAAAIALEQQRLEQKRINAEALEQQTKLEREQKKLEADATAKALEEEKALELVPTLFAQAEKDYENQQEALKAKALEQEQLNADAAAIALEQQRLEQERIDTEALEQKKLEADAAAIALEQQRLEQKRINAEALEQQTKLEREQKKLEADATAKALEEEKALELVPTLFAQAEKDYENQQEALKAKALEQEQLNADAAAIALEQQRLEQERIDTEALEQKKLEADAAAIALEQQRLEQERINAEALEQQTKLEREQKKLEADATAKALEEEKALELVPTLFAQAEKDYENQQEALKAKALEQEQLNADAKAITQPQTQEEVTEEAATTGIIQSNDEENNTSKALTDDESDISKQSLDNSIIKEEENINDEKEKDNDQQLSQNLEPLEVEVLVSKKISGIDQSEEIILEEDRLENIKAKIHSAYNYIRDIINKPAILERVKYFLSAGPAAAGDEDTTIEKGVWISGLYNINKHGVWKDMPGYKGRTTGVTIGADTEFNDNDLLGIAYSNMRSNLKYNKNCDKVNIDGHAFSLYGLKELKKNFSLQAVATILHNYVKNKIIYSGNHITGKYRNTSLSFETLLNYRHQAKRGINIIPHIGLRYGHTKDGSYKNHDIGTQHLTVAGKSQQLWTGIIGGRILFAPKNISDSIILIPTLHGSIEKHFNSKNTAVNATITWKDKSLEKIITLPKQPKIGYNIGAGIVAKKSNTTIFMEYNCRLHKKYQSHQGMAKLKINF